MCFNHSAETRLKRIRSAYRCSQSRLAKMLVASAAASVIPHYRKLFKAIEFAIYCRPDETRNYTAFRDSVELPSRYLAK